MRLVLVDKSDEIRCNFFPLALSRPLWELRCGMISLEEKLAAKLNANDPGPDQTRLRRAYFVPDYMADAYRARAKHPVNDISVLGGDDLILVDPLVKADSFDVLARGKSEIALNEQGRLLYARIAKDDVKQLDSSDIDKFLASAKARLPNVCKVGWGLPHHKAVGGLKPTLRLWMYIWDLILANAEQITSDFAAAGKSGIEGTIEQPAAIRGSKKDVYVAPKARVHPMVVIDAEGGPVYIDEGAEIQPFSRIEGPCYIGKKSILMGAKCRAGNTIGPVCRIGGEVEASIIHGYSNKYHDGFVGHSYIGEWVNLGALTSNSDLKNDYSAVSVMFEGRRSIDTGSPKVGSLIGDHTKTSIGTLLNTGSYVGAMAVIMATGKLLPKFIPSFAWFVEGVVTKGFGRTSLYKTAKEALSRRNCEWTKAEQAMWDAVFEVTAPARNEAIKRGRRAMAR